MTVASPVPPAELGDAATAEMRTAVGGWAGLRARPVVVFAALGVTFVALQGFIYMRWVVSGSAEPVPSHPGELPARMAITSKAWELASPFMVVAFLVWLARRARHDPARRADLLFCLAYPFVFWQDALLNYFNDWFVYNNTLLNLGSWAGSVPGWQSPHLQLAQPLGWILPCYVYAFANVGVAGGVVTRFIERRRPGGGLGGPFLCCFAVLIVVNALGETLGMAITGMWAYPGAIPSLTLFRGHYFQYPIYEGVFWALTGTLWTLVRHQGAGGVTYVERGIDALALPHRRRRGVRLLAVIGATNLAMLVGYNTPISLLHLRERPWIADLCERPYLATEMCEGESAR